MKKATLFIALLGIIGILQAQHPIDATKALRVAEQVLGTSQLVDRSTELSTSELYLFAPVDSIGFVLVSADACARPVVGYSTTSIFRADAAPVRAWLADRAQEIAHMRQQGIEPTPEIAECWQQLLKGTSLAPKSTPIGPLLTTRWNQTEVYQQRAPYSESRGAHCLAGCGAIAMAQIMKYWNHPASGRSSHAYYTNTYNLYLEANFDTAYDWAHMPDTLTFTSPQEEQDAVNQLIYHAGVALDMDYTPDWSSSYTYFDDYYGQSVETVMPTFFKYRPTIRAVTMCEYSAAEWDSLLMVELRALRPVIYRGADPRQGGHIFVLDGCDGDGNFHINWGWGGYCDGFYAMGSLNPTSNMAYNNGNCAVIGIEPLTTEDSSITITTAVNNPEWGSVSGEGTFNAYHATVCLLATANEGYRFDHWTDGSINNPRYYPACESRADTAVFVSAGSDTVGYCLPRYRWGYGFSDGSESIGAVCLPAATLRSDRCLAAAQVYSANRGSYTINIHLGNENEPGPVIYTKTFNVNRINRWVTLQFDSLVDYSTNQPLWISMQTTNISYSIPVSRYSGSSKSFLFSRNGNNWYDAHADYGYLSAMLRAVFANPNPGPNAISDVVADGTEIKIQDRTVDVMASTPVDVALYDLSGRLLCVSHDNSLHYTAPAAGVYLLRVGEKTTKIVLH